jgi:hypothetical protein
MGRVFERDLPRRLRRESGKVAARAGSGSARREIARSEVARCEGVALPFGVALRAVDGRALGRLRAVGLDPFGRVNALMTARCVYPAAAMRSASETAHTVVVDPKERHRIVVVRELGPRMRVWCTDDKEFKLLGVRLDLASRLPTSIIVRPRPRGQVRELRWSTVFVDGDGLPVAMYCRRRTGGRASPRLTGRRMFGGLLTDQRTPPA